MDFNNKIKDSLSTLLGLSNEDISKSLSSSFSKAPPTIPSISSSGYADMSAGYSPEIYKTLVSDSASREMTYISKLIVGSHDIEKVLDEICKALDIQTVNNVSKTNLDNLRQMSAERLAYFIVHESKKIVSGGGDATEELVEWLKSKPE